MDQDKALSILQALSAGTDPITGAPFPASSTYQHPDVVRALFQAVRALETAVAAQKRQAARPSRRQFRQAVVEGGGRPARRRLRPGAIDRRPRGCARAEPARDRGAARALRPGADAGRSAGDRQRAGAGVDAGAVLDPRLAFRATEDLQGVCSLARLQEIYKGIGREGKAPSPSHVPLSARNLLLKVTTSHERTHSTSGRDPATHP